MGFAVCEKCNKKLIKRLPNGVWHFLFGEREGNKPVVDIEIHGSIKMTCLRRSCRHVNVLNFFPYAHNPEMENK